MALIKPNPPQQFRQALVTGVAEFMDKNDPMRNVLVQAQLALHVFTLTLDSVPEGGCEADLISILTNAKSAGWRFLATNVLSGVSIAGDVVGNQDTPPRMTSLSRDAVITRAIAAVNEVETFSEVQTAHYELRVLRIPGILLEAFWLVSLSGGDDLIIPVLTRSPDFEKMRVYTVPAFMTIVQKLAPEFREFDNPPEPQYTAKKK